MPYENGLIAIGLALAVVFGTFECADNDGSFSPGFGRRKRSRAW